MNHGENIIGCGLCTITILGPRAGRCVGLAFAGRDFKGSPCVTTGRVFVSIRAGADRLRTTRSEQQTI